MKNFLCAVLNGCIAATLIWSTTYAQPSKAEQISKYVPKDGFVPDAKTAIRIAVAVWSPIYGEKKIQREKPYKAKLKNGVWLVEGSLPKGYLGGVAYASISKRDGRILNVIHTK